ncbi:MAG: HAMP domain-containing sensor histidine kinase [Cyanobacteriota bacterium]
MLFNRSRQNLATWFTLSMGSILVIFAALLYWREARDRLQTFDADLYNTAQIMAGGVEEIEYQSIRRIDLESVPLLGKDTLALDTYLHFARWYTPDRRLLQFVGDIPAATLDAPIGLVTLAGTAGGSGFPAHPSRIGSPQQLRQLTLPVRRGGEVLGFLQIAASLDSVREPLRELRLFLSVGVPMALGAIACTGWILGGVAMQPIRQSYQHLQQFTADASHELRAPLAGILSNAQVGLMEPVDPQEQSQRLQTIVEIAESMSALVGQLLFLARHSGHLPPSLLQSVDLGQLVQQLVDKTQAQAVSRQQTLRCMTPETAVPIFAEPQVLQMAIANLLHNACRYTPAGGTIDLVLTQQSSRAILQVRDTGIGIDAADLPHIFDRFYRADTVRSRETGGVGLGLAIARQIVEAHQGRISVRSQIHQGTVFEIQLPLERQKGKHKRKTTQDF